MKNSEQPIYPIIIEQKTSRYATVPDTILECKSSGLTKREYFAAMAMQAWISTYTSENKKKIEEWAKDPKRIAELSISYADALLTELEKSNQ